MENPPGSLCSFPCSPCDSVPCGELLSTEILTHTAASQQPTKGWSFLTLQWGRSQQLVRSSPLD